MEAIGQFLAMDGHAAYIWPAFLVTAAVMIGLLVASLRARTRERATLAALDRALAERSGAAATPERPR
ncbi:MAG: heme exporter protein CcmD [Alphaproteobacteria bacterium]|nr:heme exporter protein CcmD [Alphaproteobacteria bacterium]